LSDFQSAKSIRNLSYLSATQNHFENDSHAAQLATRPGVAELAENRPFFEEFGRLCQSAAVGLARRLAEADDRRIRVVGGFGGSLTSE